MKHLHRFNEEYRMGDVKIEPDLLELVQTNEQYNDIIEEFDLKPIEINNDFIHMKNDVSLELVVNVSMNNIIVKLGRKELHNSSFFSKSDKKHIFNREGRLESKMEYLFYFTILGLMEAVWRHNYPKVFDILAKMPPEKIEEILPNTELTLRNVQTLEFGNGKQKYHLLKNLIEQYPRYVLQLEHLPKSIDDKEIRANIEEIEKLAPGFL